MNMIQKFLFAVAAMIFSMSAVAHPGHDHQAPTSMLTHVFFYGSIVAGIALIAFASYQYVKNKADK